MRTLEQIATDLRQITQLVIEPSDEGVVECPILGTTSGIPGAFVDALDRADPTGHASEALQALLVEYAAASAASSPGPPPRAVILKFASGNTFVSTQ